MQALLESKNILRNTALTNLSQKMGKPCAHKFEYVNGRSCIEQNHLSERTGNCTGILRAIYSIVATRFQYSKHVVLRFPSVLFPVVVDQLLNLVKSDKTRCSTSDDVQYPMSYLSWALFFLSATIRQFYTYVFPASRCRFEREQLVKLRKESRGIAKKRTEDYLVSVIIPTYNRADLLTSRTIPSVLNQTHRKLEIIIVGDHCTDDTEKKVKRMLDNRIQFINQPGQGVYPKNKKWRWQVAGTTPINIGLDLATGDWVSHMDDDDEFSPDHIETLLRFALENDYEMTYGIMERELSNGKWVPGGSPNPGISTHMRSSVLCINYLKFFKWDVDSWKLNEPGDGNVWKRMRLAGVRMGFLPSVLGKCYFSRHGQSNNELTGCK